MPVSFVCSKKAHHDQHTLLLALSWNPLVQSVPCSDIWVSDRRNRKLNICTHKETALSLSETALLLRGFHFLRGF